MNFLELCQRVYDEGDRASYKIESVRVGPDEDEQVAHVIAWVKQAYLEIQSWNQNFKFHHTFGTFFSTTDDGETDYTKTGVRNLLRDSLYARRQGETIGWRLTYLTYRQWRNQFLNTDLADSTPVWFTELPNGQYRITPGSNRIYDIEADWYTSFAKFERDGDEPIWKEDDHEIIVWVALQYYMAEYETPEELALKVKLGLRFAKKQFYLQYLPEIELTGSFAI